MSDLTANRIRLLMALRGQGISDRRVLSAIERVPRECFVAGSFGDQAYDDTALPIECGQTISQPFIVAYMSQALQIDERHKVLEIGTGSGYQAAVLAHLCRRVYTVERYRTLLKQAEARFAALDLHTISTRLGDGGKGWPEQAPFDRIIVTAAAPDVPPVLVDQLAASGIMIVPIGDAGDTQRLVRIRKRDVGEVGYDTDELLPVRFVPLIEGVAQNGG